MNRSGTVFLILCMLFIQKLSFGQFDVPDTVCVGQKLHITNYPTGGESKWNYDAGNLFAKPESYVMDEFLFGDSTVRGEGPAFIHSAKDGDYYYMFIAQHLNPPYIYRLKFYQSLENTPVMDTVIDVSPYIFGNDIIEGIQIHQDEGIWYGYVSASLTDESSCLLRLNFGTDLGSTPTVENLGNPGGFNFPHVISIHEVNNKWYGFLGSTWDPGGYGGSGGLTTIVFNNGLGGDVSTMDFHYYSSGSIGLDGGPTGLHALKTNGIWFVFASRGSNVFKIKFDTTLNYMSTDTFGNIGGIIKNTRDLSIVFDCDEPIGIAVNGGDYEGESNTRHHPDDGVSIFNFDGGIDGPVLGVFHEIEAFKYAHSMSEIYREGDNIFTFVADISRSKLIKLKFVPSSGNYEPADAETDSIEPAVISYNNSGRYNISLMRDDDPETMACKTVTVFEVPKQPEITAEEICSGHPVLLTDYYYPKILYRWSGPNGFFSTEPDPIIYESGIYSLFYAWGNCSSDTVSRNVNVVDKLTPPEVKQNPVNTCYDSIPWIDVEGNMRVNFKWYDDSLLTNPVHISPDTLYNPGVTAPGNYRYWVTQSAIVTVDTDTTECESDPDTVNLQIHQTPRPTVTNNKAFCEGDTITPFTATGAIIRWFSDAQRDSLLTTDTIFLPADTLPGTYHYYIDQLDSLTGCPSRLDTVTMTIHAIPDTPLVADLFGCAGVDIPGHFHAAGAAGNNFIWYEDSLMSNPLDTATDFYHNETTPETYHYWVTQLDFRCEGKPVKAELIINQAPQPPTISYSNTTDTSIEVCYGDTVTTMLANKESGASIYWYNRLNTNHPDDTLAMGDSWQSNDLPPANYNFVARQKLNGCVSNISNALHLFVKPVPAPASDVDGLETGCYGNANPVLTINDDQSRWYNDSALSQLIDEGGNFVPPDTIPGNYTYFVTRFNNYNCESSPYSFDFEINNKPPQTTEVAGHQYDICVGDNIPVLPVTVAPQWDSIEWHLAPSPNIIATNTPEYKPTIDSTMPGLYNYAVRQKADGCWSDFYTIPFIVTELPAAPVVNDTITCFGKNITISPANTSQGTVHWCRDSLLENCHDTGSTLKPDTWQTGIYNYYVYQEIACMSPVNNFTVTIEPGPDIDAGPPDTLTCKSESLVLAGNAGGQVEWTTREGHIVSGVQTLNPTVDLPGIYTLTAVSDSGCVSIDSTQVFKDVVSPFADAGSYPGDFNCYDTVFVLKAEGDGTFSWSSHNGQLQEGHNTSEPVIVKPGMYYLSVTGNNGCQSTDSLMVNRESPDIVCPANTSRIAESGSGKYDVTGNEFDPVTVDDKCGTVSLSNSINDSASLDGAQVGSDTRVTWIATNESGLSDTCSFFLRIQAFVIPNIFTPNGDGHFDTWQFTIADAFPNAIIKVYNRWGELIYVSKKGYHEKWDGSVNGAKVPLDSYPYTILNNGKVIFKGSVTVFY